MKADDLMDSLISKALEEVSSRHPDAAAATEAGLVTGAADELRFDVQGGFVEVNDNRVIVLCDAAEPAGTEP